MHLSNLEREIAAHGSAVGGTLLKHFAGVLGSAVREHDWVYRWDSRDFLVVMPRAIPATARARMQQVVARAAPLLVASVDVAIRAEVTTAVAPFSGGEDLGAAVTTVASDSSLQ
jgi:GGDEF domain-containing protein